jgi:hypothetical protein
MASRQLPLSIQVRESKKRAAKTKRDAAFNAIPPPTPEQRIAIRKAYEEEVERIKQAYPDIPTYTEDEATRRRRQEFAPPPSKTVYAEKLPTYQKAKSPMKPLRRRKKRQDKYSPRLSNVDEILEENEDSDEGSDKSSDEKETVPPAAQVAAETVPSAPARRTSGEHRASTDVCTIGNTCIASGIRMSHQYRYYPRMNKNMAKIY